MMCYLIERNREGRSQYLGSVAMLEGKRWYSTAHAAIKFADRPSAQTVAHELLIDEYKIEEHVFPDSTGP